MVTGRVASGARASWVVGQLEGGSVGPSPTPTRWTRKLTSWTSALAIPEEWLVAGLRGRSGVLRCSEGKMLAVELDEGDTRVSQDDWGPCFPGAARRPGAWPVG